MTTETKDLPVVGYYGLNDSGYDVIALKENAVLRMFDAGEVTAQPVCLVSDALEAIRASATSASEQKPIMRQPFSYEQDSALCEANCNAESDAFFAARPALDSDANRRIFYAGHRRAWISYPAASAIAQPATPQPAEGA